LAISAVLFAGSLQASIIYNQTSGLGIGPGPKSIFQDFSSPTTTEAQEAILAGPGFSTGLIFSNLTLTANSNLYYDPNGAAGCGLGKGGTLPNLVACVGNYSLSGAPSGSLQNYPQTDLSSITPDMVIDFTTPVYATSFLFAAPGGKAGVNNVQIDIYNGTQKLDTQSFRSRLMSGAYVVISENTSFTEVVITQLPGSRMNTTFNALVGDVKALTAAPEPGTIGLLGFGLVGVGYFARRRKA
jgi:hypothetical protein